MEIKHANNHDGTLGFYADGENTLVIRIDEPLNRAEVVKIKAEDADSYTGLLKSAAMYTMQRGIVFSGEDIAW